MLIGLTGYARSGKDSVANILVRDHGYTKLGFADGVREMALAIDPYVDCGPGTHFALGNTTFARYSDLLQYRGYERAKESPDVRRLLQRIGTEAVRAVLGPDVWVNRTLEQSMLVPGDPYKVVISDVRFPNEAEAIKAAGGIIVRIERPGYGGTDPHPSEAQVADIETNATITATDMAELEAGVALFMAGLAGYQETMATIAAQPEPVRIYLAAPWAHKGEAIVAKQALQDAGLVVVSTWTEREEDLTDYGRPVELQRQGALDRDEVVLCNALMLLNLSKSEGKASEMGMALALGKRVILVGPREGNIFYHLAQVEQVDTLEQAIALLGGGGVLGDVQHPF